VRSETAGIEFGAVAKARQGVRDFARAKRPKESPHPSRALLCLLIAISLHCVAESKDAAANSTAGSTSAGPVIESWDGAEWRFEGGLCPDTNAPALARRDVQPLEFADSMARYLRLRVCGVGATIAVMDAVSVLAVDHEPGTTVAPDSFESMHTVGHLDPPIHAVSDDGADALAAVSLDDGVFWRGARRHRDPAVAGELTDGLEADFVRPIGSRTARVVVDTASTLWASEVLQATVKVHGFQTETWFQVVLADTSRSRRLRQTITSDSALGISVWTLGGWETQGFVWATGPGKVRRTVVPLDLSRTIGGTIRVRIMETPGFWQIDRVAIDTSPESRTLSQEVRPETVRNGVGADVRGPWIAEDLANYAVAPGDTVELRFRLPPISKRLERTYFVQTTAWQRPVALDNAQPDPAATEELMSGPGGLARFSVTRMNTSLAVTDSTDGGRR
jgi:hypothetical protein